MPDYFRKMIFNVLLGHCKADKSNRRQIMRIEVFSPIGRNVAALYDQVLSVLDCGLDDLADDGPQIFCESIIVFRRQTGIAAVPVCKAGLTLTV